MCDTVYVNDRECQTIAELREVAPAIVYAKFVDVINNPYRESDCLCGIDIPATAVANGMTCIDGGTYYEFYPAEGK